MVIKHYSTLWFSLLLLMLMLILTMMMLGICVFQIIKSIDYMLSLSLEHLLDDRWTNVVLLVMLLLLMMMIIIGGIVTVAICVIIHSIHIDT